MLPRRGILRHPLDPPPFTPGTYRHYKGGMYEALGVACHEETHKWLVIYKPLGNHKGLPDMWARPYEEFTGTVTAGEAIVPRFTPVSKEIVDEG